jgi:hypothetical protein
MQSKDSSSVSNQSNKFKHGLKLNKDEKAVIEELSTTNVEYKKVNTFLINEIEKLKKENDFLKVELLKIHMTESFISPVTNKVTVDSSNLSTVPRTEENVKNLAPSISPQGLNTIDSTQSSPTNTVSSSSNSSSSIIASSQTSNTTNSSSLNDISSEYIHHSNNNTCQPLIPNSGSNRNSELITNAVHMSSRGVGFVGGAQKVNRQLIEPHAEVRAPQSNRIDLSRYINNDDDDDDDDDVRQNDDEDDLFNNSGNIHENLNDSDYMYNHLHSGNMPPNEFTID